MATSWFTKYGLIQLNLTQTKGLYSTVGITDNYDEKKLNVNQSDIKAYDGKTGKDVTAMFDIKVENGVITANLKDGFTKSLGDKDNYPNYRYN